MAIQTKKVECNISFTLQIDSTALDLLRTALSNCGIETTMTDARTMSMTIPTNKITE